MGLFGRNKTKSAESSDVTEPTEQERAETYRRASTSQVSIAQIRAKMLELEGKLDAGDEEPQTEYDLSNGSKEVKEVKFARSSGSNGSSMKNSTKVRRGSCLDLTQSLLDFIPSPLDEIESRGAAGRSVLNKSLFLGFKPEEEEISEGSDNDEDPDDTTPTPIDASAFLNMDPDFESVFGPEDMRCLALVSHNNMKDSMRQFVLANKNVLKKFRLTGTNTTMSMLKQVFGDDPEVVYGPACKSGPLGGDAQLVAMAVSGQVGGCIFFIDPMDAHPHSADIECLVRQGNVHNLLMMNNPTTAHVGLNALRVALKMGRMEMIPSFFFDLESPSVAAYKTRQQNVLQNAIGRMRRRSLIAQADMKAKQIYDDQYA